MARASKRFSANYTLAAQVQLGDQGGVTLAIDLGQVVKKATTLRDHLKQAAARVIVLLVGLEVLGEVGDAFRQDRDLDLGRTGVASGAGVLGDDFVLTFSSNRHRSFLSVRQGSALRGLAA